MVVLFADKRPRDLSGPIVRRRNEVLVLVRGALCSEEAPAKQPGTLSRYGKFTVSFQCIIFSSQRIQTIQFFFFPSFFREWEV